jgi:hypothetical protein
LTGAEHRYAAFGLDVRSNLRMDGLPGARDGGPTVRVRFAERSAPAVE